METEGCCEGRYHAVLANCFNCGRIVCEMEGSGPCATCGTYIEGDDLPQCGDDYDSFPSSARRRFHENMPPVIDDDDCYFNMTTNEYDDRSTMLRLNSKRVVPKVTYDSEGRQIPLATNSKIPDSAIPSPQYDEKNINKEVSLPTKIPRQINKTRVQDSDLQSMTDSGMCLSVHQPFASLILEGIKKFEGRMWYTSFRGRLWIHAGAKRPDDKTIQEVENFYRVRNGDDTVFPMSYPVGCILGCVNQSDCLSQEEYSQRYPEGECGDLFVSVYENPQKVKVPIFIRGKKGIFPLTRDTHQAAQQFLQMK